jgi:hypothetical protein
MTSCRILILGFISFVMVGCGKTVQNSSSDETQDPDIVRTPGLNTSELKINLEMNPQRDQFALAHVQLPEDGWARIPEAIAVKAGSPLIITSKIFLNTKNNQASGELFCKYTSIRQVTGTDEPSADGYNHYFRGCFQDVDSDGEADELNYNVGHEVAVDKGNYITLEVQSDNSVNSLVINTEIEIDWL